MTISLILFAWILLAIGGLGAAYGWMLFELLAWRCPDED
jgi:hypothetical protein